jgi:hypothetical protein
MIGVTSLQLLLLTWTAGCLSSWPVCHRFSLLLQVFAEPVTFNYSEPQITDVVPNILDARGERLVKLYGNNFGFLSRDRLTANGSLPAPVVHFNGRPCLTPALVPSPGK